MSEVGKHLLRLFWRWPEEPGGGRMCFSMAFVSVLWNLQPLWTPPVLARTDSSLQTVQKRRQN